MRIDGFGAYGLISFPRPIAIDFTKIKGPLIAVVGRNHAGKSTFLQCMTRGALDRETPRGPLRAIAIERDTYIETKLVNGQPWTIRHLVDGASSGGSSLVLNAAGESALRSGKVTEFDAWRKKHLPPTEVLEASIFRHQKNTGFLGMKDGARKDLILQLKGISSLEKKAERARKRASKESAKLETVVARIADERERAGNVAEAEEAVKVATEHAEAAERDLAAARAAHAKLTDDAARIRAELAELETKAARGRELETELAGVRDTLAGITVRIGNNEAVLGDAEAIREAVSREAVLALEIQGRTAEAAEHRRTQVGHQKDAQAAAQRLRDATTVLEGAKARLARAEARLRDESAILRAAESLPGLREAIASAEANETEAQARVDEWRGAALGVAEKRIGVLRPGLDRIAQGPDGNREHYFDGEIANDIACDVVKEDDDVQKRAGEAPAQLKAAEQNLSLARGAVARARRALQDAQAIAGRAAEIASARADADVARREIAAEDENVAAARARAAEATRDEQAALAAVTRVDAALEGLRVERAEIDARVKKAPHLATAEARLAELRPQRQALTDKIAALGVQIAGLALPADHVAPAVPDLAESRRFVDEAENEAKACHAMVATRRARLEAAQLALRKIAELEVERAKTEQELAEWNLLADALGKDGIQALEVDAAGPELTQITNDLLHTCFGPQWTVRIETTYQSKDGKKQLEGCPVTIIDSVQNTQKLAEVLCGGEETIIGEAVSLAFAMVACRQWGMKDVTLVRDESGGALDAIYARQYIAMLRRAVEMIGARHCIFVSHSEAVQELADSRIEIADGEVRVAA